MIFSPHIHDYIFGPFVHICLMFRFVLIMTLKCKMLLRQYLYHISENAQRYFVKMHSGVSPFFPLVGRISLCGHFIIWVSKEEVVFENWDPNNSTRSLQCQILHLFDSSGVDLTLYHKEKVDIPVVKYGLFLL